MSTLQLKVVGTQTHSSGFCSHKKIKRKYYFLLLQGRLWKFCGGRKKLNLFQCLLYGWRCRDGYAPTSLAQEAFLCFLHSPWAWMYPAHGSITVYSITGFFSLILLPNFPSGAFRGLYFSSFSPVERRRVAPLPFRSG